MVAALGRGFAEIARAGRQVPRLVAVQPEGCATLAPALRGDTAGLTADCTTSVSGLQVAQLFDAFGAVDAVRSGNGHVVEVTDAEIYAAQEILARESGLLVEPAGATAYAGVLFDARRGVLDEADRVIVIGTGAGSKDAAALERIAGVAAVQRISADQIREVLDERS